MTVAVLVPAAGLGSRMGGVRKPLMRLGGRRVLDWALAPFLDRSDVTQIVVALGAGEALGRGDARVRAVTGGRTRFESVAAALDALDSGEGIVVVHDGARPFPPPAVVAACIELAGRGVGAVAGVRAVDTIKRVDGGDAVVETPPRGTLWQAQTPQAFPRDVFERAVRRCREGGWPATDDASMVERSGAPVRMVESASTNIKVTRLADLTIAEALIAGGLVEGGP